jgi:ParB family chromosome partitioning protein
MSPSSRRSFLENERILYLSPFEITPAPQVRASSRLPAGLRNSIAAKGILQPLSVCPRAGGYGLLSGRQRLRAAKAVGLRQVPCFLTQQDLPPGLLEGLEYLQRPDLDFVTEATILAYLLSTYPLSQRQAADLLGISQSALSNKLRILRLSPALLAQLQLYGLSQRHGRALLRLPEDLRAETLREIRAQHLTVSQSEELVERKLSCFT